jgi:TctA family transporter
MSLEATVTVDRLTRRIAQLETSNMALSGVVATVVAIAIFAMASVMIAHVSRANAAQQSISSCSASKQTNAPCRARKPPYAERIVTA